MEDITVMTVTGAMKCFMNKQYLIERVYHTLWIMFNIAWNALQMRLTARLMPATPHILLSYVHMHTVA